MSYSDHQRRLNIVGDAVGYERVFKILNYFKSKKLFYLIKDEDLLPVVYIGYNTGVKIPYEGILREVFKQYVDVKNVLIKQAPSNSGLRSFALVEFMDVVCF